MVSVYTHGSVWDQAAVLTMENQSHRAKLLHITSTKVAPYTYKEPKRKEPDPLNRNSSDTINTTKPSQWTNNVEAHVTSNQKNENHNRDLLLICFEVKRSTKSRKDPANYLLQRQKIHKSIQSSGCKTLTFHLEKFYPLKAHQNHMRDFINRFLFFFKYELFLKSYRITRTWMMMHRLGSQHESLVLTSLGYQ